MYRTLSIPNGQRCHGKTKSGSELVDLYVNLAGQDSRFDIDVALGRVPGVRLWGIVGRSSYIGNDASGTPSATFFHDVWENNSGNLEYPTGAETWEILSDNPNDTDGGTGANSVRITYMQESDRQYVNSSILSLNGNTPVQVTTDGFRPFRILVWKSGSSQGNEGTITLRQVGTNKVRDIIPATTPSLPISTANSRNGFYTVPTGYTVLFKAVRVFTPKGGDGIVIVQSAVNLTSSFNTWFEFGTYPFNDNGITSDPQQEAGTLIGQGGELRVVANSANPNTLIQVYVSGYLLENAVVFA